MVSVDVKHHVYLLTYKCVVVISFTEGRNIQAYQTVEVTLRVEVKWKIHLFVLYSVLYFCLFLLIYCALYYWCVANCLCRLVVVKRYQYTALCTTIKVEKCIDCNALWTRSYEVLKQINLQINALKKQQKTFKSLNSFVDWKLVVSGSTDTDLK